MLFVFHISIAGLPRIHQEKIIFRQSNFILRNFFQRFDTLTVHARCDCRIKQS